MKSLGNTSAEAEWLKGSGMGNVLGAGTKALSLNGLTK